MTWNKQGPQGANGAPGAQGPAGPAEGYANERFDINTDFSAKTQFVAASFTPASTGDFAVYGTAVIEPLHDNSYECWDRGGTNTANVTPSGVFSTTSLFHSVTIPTAGIIAAGPTVPIYEICEGFDSGDYRRGEVVGIHLNAAHLTLVGEPARRGAGNKFSKKK